MKLLRTMLFAISAVLAIVLVAMLLHEQPIHDGQKCTLLDSKTPYEQQKQMRCPDGKIYDR